MAIADRTFDIILRIYYNLIYPFKFEREKVNDYGY